MYHRGIIGVLVFLLSVPAVADVRVSGYTRKDGTYVKPHYRSSPDGKFGNNWSTYGNTNPHTGKPGWLKQPSGSSSNYAPGNVYRTRAEKLNEVTSREVKRQRAVTTVKNPYDHTDEDKAASKLRLAVTCTRQGKHDDARVWLRQIIAEYPQTKAASTARDLLSQ